MLTSSKTKSALNAVYVLLIICSCVTWSYNFRVRAATTFRDDLHLPFPAVCIDLIVLNASCIPVVVKQTKKKKKKKKKSNSKSLILGIITVVVTNVHCVSATFCVQRIAACKFELLH